MSLFDVFLFQHAISSVLHGVEQQVAQQQSSRLSTMGHLLPFNAASGVDANAMPAKTQLPAMATVGSLLQQNIATAGLEATINKLKNTKKLPETITSASQIINSSSEPVEPCDVPVRKDIPATFFSASLDQQFNTAAASEGPFGVRNMKKLPATVTSASQMSSAVVEPIEPIVASVGQDFPDTVPAAGNSASQLLILINQLQPKSSQQDKSELSNLLKLLVAQQKTLTSTPRTEQPRPGLDASVTKNRSRVCKMAGCPFCSRNPCGSCGNCLHYRRNKCVHRYRIGTVIH